MKGWSEGTHWKGLSSPNSRESLLKRKHWRLEAAACGLLGPPGKHASQRGCAKRHNVLLGTGREPCMS